MRIHIDLRNKLGSPGTGFDNRYLRILALYLDMPILDIAKSDAPAVYVVDVAKFAILTRYGAEPDFSIEEFDEERARALLRENPRLIPEPPPESGLEVARVQQLQLKVGLRLDETWDLDVRDPAAVFGGPLVGPIRS